MRFFTLFTLALLLLALPAEAQQEIPLGSTLPRADAPLTEAANGQPRTLSELAGPNGLVLIFWSNQCPWVSRYQDRVFALADEYGDRFGFALINANDPTAFPRESQQESAAQELPLPYLMDEGAELARALGASRAPHIFVFDANQTLTYVGALDDSPGSAADVQETYLRDALGALASGSPVPTPQTQAFGCTIKFPE